MRSERPDCPPPLAALVMQCLEKDPDRRPQSARTIQEALDSGMTRVTGNAYSPATRRKLVLGAAASVVLVATLAFVALSRPRSTTADNHSVAVLPFDNEAGDTANAYFGEGIAEELITGLSSAGAARRRAKLLVPLSRRIGRRARCRAHPQCRLAARGLGATIGIADARDGAAHQRLRRRRALERYLRPRHQGRVRGARTRSRARSSARSRCGWRPARQPPLRRRRRAR